MRTPQQPAKSYARCPECHRMYRVDGERFARFECPCNAQPEINSSSVEEEPGTTTNLPQPIECVLVRVIDGGKA